MECSFQHSYSIKSSHNLFKQQVVCSVFFFFVFSLRAWISRVTEYAEKNGTCSSLSHFMCVACVYASIAVFMFACEAICVRVWANVLYNGVLSMVSVFTANELCNCINKKRSNPAIYQMQLLLGRWMSYHKDPCVRMAMLQYWREHTRTHKWVFSV